MVGDRPTDGLSHQDPSVPTDRCVRPRPGPFEAALRWRTTLTDYALTVCVSVFGQLPIHAISHARKNNPRSGFSQILFFASERKDLQKKKRVGFFPFEAASVRKKSTFSGRRNF